EGPGEPLAGEGVDARGGGGGVRLVAPLPEDRHELLADEPAAADHDDLHVAPPCWSPRTRAVIRNEPPTRVARVHSYFLSFSGMTMSLTSAGCSTTARMRVLPSLLGCFV